MSIAELDSAQALERGDVLGEEVVLQVEVLGRIARQAELGEEDGVGTLVAGTADPLVDQACIAVDVADGRVDLGERDPHLFRVRHVDQYGRGGRAFSGRA